MELVFIDINQQAYYETQELIQGIEEAMQRFMLVLATPKRSRWKRPRFGSYIGRYLFDPFDEITAGKIKSEIRDVVSDPFNDIQDIVIKTLEVMPDYTNQQYFVNLAIEIQNEQITRSFGLRRAA